MNRVCRFPRRAPALLILCLFLAPAAVRGEDVIRIDTTGLTLLDAATVSAPADGRVVEVAVREGDRVQVDQPLARLDGVHEEAELAKLRVEARAAREKAQDDVDVRIARNELELAELELRRATELNDRYENTVSLSQMERLRLTSQRKRLDLERAERDMAMAKLVAESAERGVEAVQVKLDQRRIVAPLEGIVAEVFHRPGEWVRSGEAVCRILRVDRLRAEAYVPASSLAKDIAGRSAVMRVRIPGHGEVDFPGVVTFVSPEANPVNGVVRTLAEIRNRDGLLRAGYLGALIIDLSDPPSADRESATSSDAAARGPSKSDDAPPDLETIPRDDSAPDTR